MKREILTVFAIGLVIIGIIFYLNSIETKSAKESDTIQKAQQGGIQSQGITPIVSSQPKFQLKQPVGASQTTQNQSQTQSQNQTMNNQPPTMQIDPNKTYTATLHTTDGDIVIALDAKDTPITVNNFIYLSKKNFYDNTIFHRVIKGFMIQGGDPLGDGTGGPGYHFNDEPFQGDYTRGTVAMANAGPNTNGSQFFIMQADRPDLPKSYVIFGHVASGMDVVDAIANAPVTMNAGGEDSKPVNPVNIKSVTISEQ